jgi:transposase
VTTTLRRVSPQAPGIIPTNLAERLAAAKAARDEADAEFRAAVVDALKAGGSIRAVAEVSGLSTRTVQDWGHAGGWPTPQQKRARTDARKRRAEQLREQLARWDAEREGK